MLPPAFNGFASAAVRTAQFHVLDCRNQRCFDAKTPYRTNGLGTVCRLGAAAIQAVDIDFIASEKAILNALPPISSTLLPACNTSRIACKRGGRLQQEQDTDKQPTKNNQSGSQSFDAWHLNLLS